MTFTAPVALLLLITLPFVIWIGRPRAAYRRGRDIASLILRLIILTLVILALSGAQSVRAADKLAVVFLVDVSDSMGSAARQAQIDYIRAALASMRPDDQAAVIVFGGNAIVERSMSAARELAVLRSDVNTGNTDLEEAINLGLALFPADSARRMIILSDGIATVGDAERAAQRAAATNIEISYVTSARAAAPEVRVSEVRVPATVNAGQTFDLIVTVESDAAMRAELSVEAGGVPLVSEIVDLRVGTNNFTLALQAGSRDQFSDFRARITPLNTFDDNFTQNNQLAAFSSVIGAPSVLILTTDPAESQYLADALTQQGLVVEVRDPNALPIGEAALLGYRAVVLANVPATILPTARMENLQTYVRDLGGGLVVIGGPESYAPGGYFRTPLEETLPVEMQIRDQQRLPQLTILYVIDRSGSMSMTGPSGVENIELAKEAIIRSIEFLQPTDSAGVISFDAAGYFVAPVQPVLDRFILQTLVGTLQPGGGTDILAGMRLASEAMQAIDTERKHIILLTDGGADDRGLVDLTRELNEQFNTTTSVIAIGGGTPGFLEEMALAGGGNYHAAESIESIPTIFTQETVLATRSYIIENPFVPLLGDLHLIMQGITETPPLQGYVASSPKQTAQVILLTQPENDPLLAAWQYGLGRAVAFTSDATARWGRDWVTWDGFARFWSQVVRWTILEGADANLETQVVMEGERARVIVDARTDSGAFANGGELQVNVLTPNGAVEAVTLQQTAPGRYETTFAPQGEGAYFLNIDGLLPTDSGTAQAARQQLGWVMSYSPEYTSGGENMLPILADLTGGRSLADDPALSFDRSLIGQPSITPLAPLLLLIALLLLPFDIAVRRLVITRGDIARVRAALKRAEVTETSERLSTLMDAKARAQSQTQTGETAPVTFTPAAPPPPVIQPRPAESTPSVVPTSGQPTPTADENNIAGRLLQKRRSRQSDD